MRNGDLLKRLSFYFIAELEVEAYRCFSGMHTDFAVATIPRKLFGKLYQCSSDVAKLTNDISGLESLLEKKEIKSFAEAAKDYLNERQHLKPSTLRGYNEIIKNRLVPSFGDKAVAELTERDIAALRSELSKEVSPTRVNNILGPLRYILNVCTRRKLIKDNPAVNVDPVEEAPPDIDPFTQDELDRLFAQLKPYQRPLFLCQAWTGARPNELLALRWSDIDFDKNEIKISKGMVSGREGTPKTRSSNRIIKMLSVVKEVLLDLKHGSTAHLDGYVFSNKHRQPYKKHVDRKWRTAVRKAGVRHRSSYQLGHTFASLCLQIGSQPTSLAKMLGHSTVATTFKHYARYIEDASGFNEKNLEAFISSQTNSKGSQDQQSG